VLENILKRSQLRRQAKRRARKAWAEEKQRVLVEHLLPGTLFVHKNRQVYVVFQTHSEMGRWVCTAHNVRRTLRFRKGQFRLKTFDMRHIRSVLNYRVELHEGDPPEKLRALLASIPLGELQDLRVQGSGREAAGHGKGEEGLPCEGCVQQSLCHGKETGELRKLLKEFQILIDQMAGAGEGLWLSFKRHIRFLKETGFVDEKDRLTQDGLWASKLRLDHPLLIAEAIRKGAFSGSSPETVAGCMAPFVWDRGVDTDFRIESPLDLKGVEAAFRKTLDLIEDLMNLQGISGFTSPNMQFWPCAALFLWASRLPWKNLLSVIPVDEGDLTSLITRTADHLRQVTHLSETHPELSSVAAKAMDLILREPVSLD
jgi:hypothetical protein